MKANDAASCAPPKSDSRCRIGHQRCHEESARAETARNAGHGAASACTRARSPLPSDDGTSFSAVINLQDCPKTRTTPVISTGRLWGCGGRDVFAADVGQFVRQALQRDGESWCLICCSPLLSIQAGLACLRFYPELDGPRGIGRQPPVTDTNRNRRLLHERIRTDTNGHEGSMPPVRHTPARGSESRRRLCARHGPRSHGSSCG